MPMRFLRWSLVLTVCLVTAAPAVAEYYPARPVWDYNKTQGQDCSDVSNSAADHGRCGPTDGPVFDSFINTPSYGDERSFLDARLAEAMAAGSYKDVVDLSGTKAGQRLVVRLYVNNDANEKYGPKTTAHNTKVRLTVPTGSAEGLRVRGYISANNASPGEVEDTVDFVSDRPFRLRLVSGSAAMYRNDQRKQYLSNSITTDGALVGVASTDGEFPAGFGKDAVIQAELEVLNPATDASWVLRLGIAAVIAAVLVSLLYKFWKPLSRSPIWSQVVANLLVLAIAALAALPIALVFGR
jgi:hypothetical protein